MFPSVFPIDPPDTNPKSQGAFAYGSIRRGILAGRYPPGTKLKIQELSGELDVGPGAVREALSRMVSEQLVVSRDQRGFTVAPLSIADLEELTDLRCEIEAIALRRSVERGDVDWEANLLAAAHRMRSLQMKLDQDKSLRPEWAEAHALFHTALVAACGSQRLLALQAQLWEQSERYRGLSTHSEIERDVEKEHQEIVDLALARDAKGLVRAMVAHMRLTTKLIVAGARSEK